MNEEEKNQRIIQIDKRIQDLEQHREMWRKAGGHGKNMALQAGSEIRDLMMEKDDLINGTNNLEIKKIEIKINQLKLLKEKANFIKKYKVNAEIKAATSELEALQNQNSR